MGSLVVEAEGGWRYMYGVSAPVALAMAVGMWCLVESPRWLLLCAIQGKGDMEALKQDATRCLCQLRGPSSAHKAPAQVDEMLDELSFAGEEKEATIAELFRGKCRKALVIGGGLVLFQQITGQPSVLYYAASIFQVCHFTQPHTH